MPAALARSVTGGRPVIRSLSSVEMPPLGTVFAAAPNDDLVDLEIGRGLHVADDSRDPYVLGKVGVRKAKGQNLRASGKKFFRHMNT